MGRLDAPSQEIRLSFLTAANLCHSMRDGALSKRAACAPVAEIAHADTHFSDCVTLKLDKVHGWMGLTRQNRTWALAALVKPL